MHLPKTGFFNSWNFVGMGALFVTFIVHITSKFELFKILNKRTEDLPGGTACTNIRLNFEQDNRKVIRDSSVSKVTGYGGQGLRTIFFTDACIQVRLISIQWLLGGAEE
jgi:hypothetical protein